MTECNSNPIDFAGVGRRKIVADFDGGRLTTDAGILLLREGVTGDPPFKMRE